MKSYLYITVLDEKTMHNKLIKEKVVVYDLEGQLSSPDKVHKIMTDVFGMQKRAEEFLFMIALNTKCRPLGFFEISHGTVNASIVSPREIFIRAILSGATSIIITHNHPSFSSEPSIEDIKITKRIKEAGELIGIKLLDHVIIGGETFCSLKEKGLF